MSDQRTIFIIDDEAMLRSALRDVLEGHGYRVIDSGDGDRAVEIALESRPDLVLCDIEMPGKSGFDVLQEFRKNRQTSEIPFIFLTGRGDRSQMRKGMGLGADDFLAKPVTAQELYDAVDSRLRRREEQERRVKGMLEELKSRITRSIPHELRTPLTGIIGYGELLHSEGRNMTPEELSDVAARVVTSARRLEATLEKFWYYSQIVVLIQDRKASERLAMSELDGVHVYLKSYCKDKALASARQSDLTISAEEGCVRIAQPHFSKILDEVLENAFKFSGAGTPVEVTGRKADGKSFYEISVSDKGRGMTQDQIKNVGAFIQFDREKYEQQGIGLGLAVAREITTLYHGQFELQSEPEKGTRVTIRIPLCR